MDDIVKINKNRSIRVEKPNVCPHCQKGIDPKIIQVVKDRFYDQAVVYLALKCPICQQVFFVKYYVGAFGDLSMMPIHDFALHSSVGISYRLAFEHLIKDYCIKIHNDKKDDILKKSLSQCINEYLDADIKDITKRAAWLGNDYAHYESKHPDMNVDDLKYIIDICASRIESKIKEANYIKNIEKK